MKYRRFGKTEIAMPVISCGGMRFQESWKSGDPVSEKSQRNLEATIERALELGINHFETARGYGTSEFQLGKILPRLPREEIVVQTKVGPEPEVKKFQDTFEESMGLLNLEHIDLLAFHGVNNEEGIDHVHRCLDAALEYKAQGRTRFLGFSTHAPLDVILKTLELGVFDYVNLHWYYIFQDNWPAIMEARRQDMGVFIISPNEKGGLLFKSSEKLTQLTDPFHPMTFNGLFCLSRPEVHTLSCGASCPEDFDIHIKTADKSEDAAALIAPVVERLNAELEKVLGSDWLDTWQEGLPEWHETPNDINIPVILRTYNLVRAFDMHEFGKMRYNLLGSGGHWFPGKQAEDVSSVDLAPCLAKSPHRATIPKILAEAHTALAGEKRKRLQQDE